MTPTEADRPSLASRTQALQRRLAKHWPADKPYTRVGATRLCIDGPPRSANSLLVHKLRLANPRHLRAATAVSHHTHDVDSVLLAVLAGIPVIMPMRAPREAIASFVVYGGGDDPEPAMRLYIEMCKLALAHADGVLVASFETIVHNVNAVFAAANRRFDLDLGLLTTSDADANAAIAARVHAAAEQSHGDEWASKVGVPQAGRARAKREAATLVLDHPLYAQCEEFHRRIGKRCEMV